MAKRLSVGYSGVESRPIAGEGGLQKGFFHTKWAQNGMILVGLGLGPLGGMFKKSKF